MLNRHCLQSEDNGLADGLSCLMSVGVKTVVGVCSYLFFLGSFQLDMKVGNVKF